MDALEGGALAVVQTARTFPLVIDLYEGTLLYLGNLLCFLVLNSRPLRSRLRQVGPFYGKWNSLSCSVDTSFSRIGWWQDLSRTALLFGWTRLYYFVISACYLLNK